MGAVRRFSNHRFGCMVRQIKRHQRFETSVGGNVLQNTVAIAQGVAGRGNGWRQVWHHDGAPSPAGDIWHRSGQRCLVPQMDVPVIRQCQL